jgi:hypothetical protein
VALLMPSVAAIDAAVHYVLDGEGMLYAEDFEERLSPGACVQLPGADRAVRREHGHGADASRRLFRPAGSPAAARYADGTSAYPGGISEHLQRRSE